MYEWWTINHLRSESLGCNRNESKMYIQFGIGLSKKEAHKKRNKPSRKKQRNWWLDPMIISPVCMVTNLLGQSGVLSNLDCNKDFLQNIVEIVTCSRVNPSSLAKAVLKTSSQLKSLFSLFSWRDFHSIPLVPDDKAIRISGRSIQAVYITYTSQHIYSEIFNELFCPIMRGHDGPWWIFWKYVLCVTVYSSSDYNRGFSIVGYRCKRCHFHQNRDLQFQFWHCPLSFVWHWRNESLHFFAMLIYLLYLLHATVDMD